MSCRQHAQLEKQLREAQLAFEKAREHLVKEMGVSLKADYEQAKRAVEVARRALDRTRDRLEKHVREHGCRAGNGAAAG